MSDSNKPQGPRQPDEAPITGNANGTGAAASPDSMTAKAEKAIAGKTEHASDPRWPLLQAAKYGSIAIGIMSIISLLVWGGYAGVPGIWGVVIGALVGGGFVLITVLTVLATANTTPQTTQVVVMGTWLLKIVVVLVILVVLKQMDFYDRTALVVTLILALVVGLASETWGVLTARVVYVADMELAKEKEAQQAQQAQQVERAQQADQADQADQAQKAGEAPETPGAPEERE